MAVMMAGEKSRSQEKEIKVRKKDTGSGCNVREVEMDEEEVVVASVELAMVLDEAMAATSADWLGAPASAASPLFLYDLDSPERAREMDGTK